MMESSILDGDLRIGDFVVRPLLKVVRPDAAHLPAEESTLPDKAMAVLVYLAQHSRQVCDRDDILDAVWGPEREAYDRVLDNAIREIRRALHDDARNPTYIQTIPKKGYRLLVAVESRLLEKARDSSGEFVPVAKDSPQVFQRVRRAASTQTNAAAAAQTDGRSPDTAGPTDRPHEPWSRRNSLAVVAILLLLATAWAWRSGFFSSDHVTVSLDASALESISASDPMAGESTPQAAVLIEALQAALFEEHACGDQTVYRPGSWLRGADYDVRLRPSDGNAPFMLTAEIEPGRRRAVIFPDTDSMAAPGALIRDVTEQLDQAVCALERVSDQSRACHCLEGSRRWASVPDSETSAEYLEKAISLDPDLLPAYAALAEASRAVGDYEAGMSALKAGLARVDDPDSTGALKLRLQLAGLLGDLSEAERLLERLRDREPSDDDLRLAQAGFLTMHRRDCEQALEILDPLLALDDRSVAAVAEASRALWLCGHYEATVEIVAGHVESLPRQGEIRRLLAGILSLVGRYEEATRFATESMALEPERSEPYWLLGVVAGRQGHYSAAEAWYLKANELARWPKQRAGVSVGLARVARMRGDTARCVELISSYREPTVQPDEPPLLLKGLCLAESGDVLGARQAMNEFTSSLHGQSSLAFKGLATLLRAKIEMAEATTPERRQLAAARYVEAANSDPVRIDMFYFEAATALGQVGDSQGAEDMLGRALAVNPNHPWTLCRLGMIHKERGDFEAAIESMSRGLQVFGPRLEDPLAVECATALLDLDPDAEIGGGIRRDAMIDAGT